VHRRIRFHFRRLVAIDCRQGREGFDVASIPLRACPVEIPANGSRACSPRPQKTIAPVTTRFVGTMPWRLNLLASCMVFVFECC